MKGRGLARHVWSGVWDFWARRPVRHTAVAMAMGFFLGGAMADGGPFGQTMAAWVQALGGIAAVVGAAAIAGAEGRRAVARERREFRRRRQVERDAVRDARHVAAMILLSSAKRMANVAEVLEAPVTADLPMFLNGAVRILEEVQRQAANFPVQDVRDQRAWILFQTIALTAAASRGRIEGFRDDMRRDFSAQGQARVLAGEASRLSTTCAQIRLLLDDVGESWRLDPDWIATAPDEKL